MSNQRAAGAATPKQITFEQAKAVEYYPEWGLRPKTPMIPLEVSFIFINGGLGDYITWFQPIRWLASEATWIRGTIIIPTYLRELADYWLKPFPAWKCVPYTDLASIPKLDSMPFRGPVELQRESLNATGAHLSTCGWVYFTNKEKAPPGWDYYPQFEQSYLDAAVLPPEADVLKAGRYAVITTGVTTESRRIPPESWNHVIEYVAGLGLTPVFLGRAVTDTGNARNIHTEWRDGYRFDLGLDLRNKTTLTQAAAIMSRAAVVIGHDNGLLHLAGCTAAPIVFGYNLASPEHREPKRPVGRTYNVHLTYKDLQCNFCQSHMNFIIGLNFRVCVYGDNKCIDILFADRAARWKQQIDLALKDGAESRGR